MPTEPYQLGSHSGCCGFWASAPTDVGAPTAEEHVEADQVPGHLPSGWRWGYHSCGTELILSLELKDPGSDTWFFYPSREK